mgnify:FL=1
MREFGTPERVYAVVRFLNGKSYDAETLKEKLGMEGVFGKINQDAFSYATRVAEELDFIYIKDGRYSSNMDVELIDSWSKFRAHTAKIAFSRDSSIFYKTTEAYLALNDKVLSAHTWAELRQIINESGMDLSDRNIIGWRFWASFLGIGYIHGTQLIPNLFVRFSDVLKAQTQFEFGEIVDVETFFAWLERECPEIINSRSDQKLGLAVSNGLRILRDQEIIEIINQPDAVKWQMYSFLSEGIGEFSHIKVKEGS